MRNGGAAIKKRLLTATWILAHVFLGLGGDFALIGFWLWYYPPSAVWVSETAFIPAEELILFGRTFFFIGVIIFFSAFLCEKRLYRLRQKSRDITRHKK